MANHLSSCAWRSITQYSALDRFFFFFFWTFTMLRMKNIAHLNRFVNEFIRFVYQQEDGEVEGE